MAVWSDSLGNTDGGLAGAARQVENLHAFLRPRVFDQRLGHIAAHGGRLCLPFFGGDEAVGGPPIGLGLTHIIQSVVAMIGKHKVPLDSARGRLSTSLGMTEQGEEFRPSFCACARLLSSSPQRTPVPRRPSFLPTSTAAPGRNTGAPSPRTHARRNPRSRAAPTRPGCN